MFGSCAHRVCIAGVPDNTWFTLLKMIALLPDGEGLIFLRSLMKNEAVSRFVVNTCNLPTCIIVFAILMQALSDKIIDYYYESDHQAVQQRFHN